MIVRLLIMFVLAAALGGCIIVDRGHGHDGYEHHGYYHPHGYGYGSYYR